MHPTIRKCFLSSPLESTSVKASAIFSLFVLTRLVVIVTTSRVTRRLTLILSAFLIVLWSSHRR